MREAVRRYGQGIAPRHPRGPFEASQVPGRMPMSRERARRVRLPGALIARGLVLGAAVLAWQLLPSSILPAYVVSRPVPVAKNLWHLFASGEVYPHLVATTLSVLVGVALGGLIGTAVGIIAQSVRPIGWCLDPIMTMGNAIPKVGLVAFLILMVGLNSRAHVYLLVAVVVFLFYYNTVQGIREVPSSHITYFRLSGASRLTIIRLLTLPALRTYLLSATRVAIPLAYGAEIFAELEVPTTHGLGSPLLSQDAATLKPAGAIAVIIVLGVLGYLVDVAVGQQIGRQIAHKGQGIR